MIVETKIYKDNHGREIIADFLLPCPFCGGKAGYKFIGNDYTKKRSVEVKCNTCFTTQKTGAIYHCQEWCLLQAIEKWNKRFKK